MKVLCVLSRYAYGDPVRGENYDHAHFVPALRELGHTVEVFDSGDRETYANFAELNAALLQKIAAFRPDVIFTVLMHYEIWLETLDLVRAHTPAWIVNWGTDDSWKFPQATRYFAKHVDLHVTTDAASLDRAAALGLDNVMLSQWAASVSLLKEPLPSKDCRYDVTFVGSLYGDRRRWVDTLRAAGIDVQCFGHGSEHGVVASDDIPEIIRNSRISLNFTGSDNLVPGAGSGGQIKARTFEVPGAGGFLLTQHAAGLERYFRPGEEVAMFDTPDELVEQVRYYLAHAEARDRVAHAGHRRTAEHHTYAARFAEIFDRAPKASASTRDWALSAADLAPCLVRHRAGAFSRFLRCALAAPLSLAFGAARGPRAARRLVYELSWRLAGEATYRAAGWPGRLFFRES